MRKQRFWIVVVAITLCLASVGIGAQRSHSASTSPAIDPTCVSSSPCIEYDNNGSGPGIRGVGLTGNGVSGEAKFNSTSSANGRAGVIGADVSSSGVFNSGVRGTSALGAGVSGISTNGVGVQGTSTNGNGVRATSTSQSALFVQNLGNADGIQSVALNNDGTNSSTQNRSTLFGRGRSGVFGHDDAVDGGHLNVGVAGFSTSGIGISGTSTHFVGVNAVGGGSAGMDFPALSIVGTSNANNSLVAACVGASFNPCDSFDAKFIVDGVGDIITHASINADGNVDILGQYQKNGSCVAGCTPATSTSSGRAVTSYSAQESRPTIEDFGEAQLVNGQAFVPLAADFANVIDSHSNYMVFITPEGDNRGVFVSNKTRGGFAVHESQGGRSTFMFSYRIVAQPYGVSAARLPMVNVGPKHIRPSSSRFG